MDKLDLITKLIIRFDTLRTASSSRASAILAANAIILTGSIFIIDKIIVTDWNEIQRTLFYLNVLLSFLMIILSFAYAINSIVSAWVTGRELAGDGLSKSLFFHARDTIENITDFSSFNKVRIPVKAASRPDVMAATVPL